MAALLAAMREKKAAAEAGETPATQSPAVEEKDASRSNTMRRMSQASTDSDHSASRRPSLMRLQTRRRSSFKNLAHSINFMRRLSMGKILKEEKQEKSVRYENTYRMDAYGNHFQNSKVRETMERILNTYLRDQKYDERRCRTLVTDITTIVKNSVKDLNYERYKIVVNMIMGQKSDQSMEAAGRCVWDPKTDNYVTVHYDNGSLFAVCTVHAVYFE